RAAGVEAWQGRPAAAGGVDGTGGVARYWRDARARRARQGREADRAGYRIYRAADCDGSARGPEGVHPADAAGGACSPAPGGCRELVFIAARWSLRVGLATTHASAHGPLRNTAS